MINTTNTVTIDGDVLNKDAYFKFINMDSNDRFSLWVVRPLAVVATLGIGIAVFFASAFLLMLSLALVPLLAVLFWAIRKKLERDSDIFAKADSTKSVHEEALNADVHKAI